MEYKKITYLLGAGASFNTLPLVDGIPDLLNDFQITLRSLYKNSPESKKNKVNTSLLEELCKELTWLELSCREHMSIDTFAKKLSTTGPDYDLKKLKRILTLMFSYYQLIRKPQMRYDAFIAALIDHKTRQLPSHIKILTWNYDFQIEKAYSEYINSESIDKIQKDLCVYPSNCNVIDPEKFLVCKINGSTFFINKENYHTIGNSISKNNNS